MYYMTVHVSVPVSLRVLYGLTVVKVKQPVSVQSCVCVYVYMCIYVYVCVHTRGYIMSVVYPQGSVNLGVRPQW